MCIRDSPRARAPEAAAKSPLAAPVGPGNAGRRATWRGARWPARGTPVSYTHLTLPTICSV
eukprot:12671150-Alexandrium_andersonii.AAC.1